MGICGEPRKHPFIGYVLTGLLRSRNKRVPAGYVKFALAGEGEPKTLLMNLPTACIFSFTTRLQL